MNFKTNANRPSGGGIVEDTGTGEFEARYCFSTNTESIK